MGDSPKKTWKASLSGDFVLNFPIYVGCSYGLFTKSGELGQTFWPPHPLPIPDKERYELKRQWDVWWNAIVMYKSQSKGQGFRYSPGMGLADQQFSDLEGDLLRQACVDNWPAFNRWWNMPAGGQIAMYYWESVPRIERYMQKLEQLHGSLKSSLSLVVDLIYTGLDAPIEPEEGYLIIPVDGPYLLKEEWWLKMLSRYFSD
ncbi:hypothetical protein [Paenibacillus tuaregi]|uniref:hypothetical protein n=1 Tax=Paenibacillus tuaregi TaxID=1816681 RepID=UPI0008397058|nr:hypothetical protein [Paenibacillus tuaregi]